MPERQDDRNPTEIEFDNSILAQMDSIDHEKDFVVTWSPEGMNGKTPLFRLEHRCSGERKIDYHYDDKAVRRPVTCTTCGYTVTLIHKSEDDEENHS
jgi:hypothetical protein